MAFLIQEKNKLVQSVMRFMLFRQQKSELKINLKPKILKPLNPKLHCNVEAVVSNSGEE